VNTITSKDRWIDNVFIERLWRRVKYQDIHLKAYRSIGEPKKQELGKLPEMSRGALGMCEHFLSHDVQP
jgi:hypothetical protein